MEAAESGRSAVAAEAATGGGSSGGAKQPPPEPDRFEFRIAGGSWESAWQLRWRAGKLEHQLFASEAEDSEEERTVALYLPSREQWLEFWQIIDALGVWEWKPEYRAASGGPGVSWRLVLGRGSRSLVSSGHGAWPDGTGPDPSPDFGILLDALRGLLESP